MYKTTVKTVEHTQTINMLTLVLKISNNTFS